jgi:hypothetical protein
VKAAPVVSTVSRQPNFPAAWLNEMESRSQYSTIWAVLILTLFLYYFFTFSSDASAGAL